VKEGDDMAAAADEVNTMMLASHRVTEDNKDFMVITADFINTQLDQITGTLTLFMGALAGISLIVGGVGISNTMFMAAMERRKEIGTLKAIGATEKDIERLFLVESSMIGAAGGFAGLVIAFLLILLVNLSGIVSAVFIPWVAFGALIFSAFVGIVAGVFPAKQAAKLDPIETLRYE
jgi:putative ABC transport system permease protein